MAQIFTLCKNLGHFSNFAVDMHEVGTGRPKTGKKNVGPSRASKGVLGHRKVNGVVPGALETLDLANHTTSCILAFEFKYGNLFIIVLNFGH